MYTGSKPKGFDLKEFYLDGQLHDLANKSSNPIMVSAKCTCEKFCNVTTPIQSDFELIHMADAQHPFNQNILNWQKWNYEIVEDMVHP